MLRRASFVNSDNHTQDRFPEMRRSKETLVLVMILFVQDVVAYMVNRDRGFNLTAFVEKDESYVKFFER